MGKQPFCGTGIMCIVTKLQNDGERGKVSLNNTPVGSQNGNKSYGTAAAFPQAQWYQWPHPYHVPYPTYLPYVPVAYQEPYADYYLDYVDYFDSYGDYYDVFYDAYEDSFDYVSS
jgi:hypothetical protein